MSPYFAARNQAVGARCWRARSAPLASQPFSFGVKRHRAYNRRISSVFDLLVALKVISFIPFLRCRVPCWGTSSKFIQPPNIPLVSRRVPATLLDPARISKVLPPQLGAHEYVMAIS